MTVLIIFNGESNSGGYAPNTQAPANEIGKQESVRILNNTTLKFETLDIGGNNLLGHNGLTDYSLSHHGAELGLAKAARAGLFGSEPVMLVKTGQGGSIIEDWVPGNPYYETMLTRIRAAVASLPHTDIKPILWYFQGINNAKGENNLPQYRDAAMSSWKRKTLEYYARLREALGFKTLPILFSEITPQFPLWNDAIVSIKNAEHDCIVISANGCSTSDTYHWDYNGFSLLSSRFVTATVAKLIGSESSSISNHKKYVVLENSYYAGVAFLDPSTVASRNAKKTAYVDISIPSLPVSQTNCPKLVNGSWVNDSSINAVEVSTRRHGTACYHYSNYSNAIIVCDGNSITAGASIGYAWPTQLKIRSPFIDLGCSILNVAVGGQTTAQMVADAVPQVDSLYDKTKDCILIAWEIGNDLYFGATVETACANFQKYCFDRKAAGWRVIAITVCDRIHPSGTPGGDTGSQYKTKILLANTWLRGNWQSFADALIWTVQSSL
jgi:hypothetical protein